jgi:hypothetical protein
MRQARVQENQRLSFVAGDTHKAHALYRASERRSFFEVLQGQAERRASDTDLRAVPPETLEKLKALEPALTRRVAAEAALAEATARLSEIDEDLALGLGGSSRERAQAREAVDAAQRALDTVSAEVNTQLAAVRGELEPVLPKAADAIIDSAVARAGLAYWNARLEEEFLGDVARRIKPVEGEAAKRLAEAQALRWQQELRAVAEFASLSSQYEAYAAAPDIYQARLFLEVLTDGLKNARKFFLAFDPGDRKVHIRVEAQDSGESSLMDMQTRAPQ